VNVAERSVASAARVPVAQTAAGLSARSLGVSAGTRQLVSDLSLDFEPGQFTAILGRNGSGKTLTLHTLAGLRRPQHGSVLVRGTCLEQMKRRAIALEIGLLMQDLEESFTMTALESVLIGRHPHLSSWQWESSEDERIAREALSRVNMLELASRTTDALSGGERRRVAIASLLAQAPQIFLLDEPTNHLDPHHQVAVLELFRQKAMEGSTVIATLHDPTLAARVADHVILLFGDGRWSYGPTRDALTAESLSQLYLTPMVEIAADGRRAFVNA
jgi:iron complex transport system ATP-binding protein